MRSRVVLSFAFVSALPLATAALAAESRGDGLLSALAACRTVAEGQRLACYEQASAALIAARDQRQIRIIDREAVQQAKRSLFGFSLPRLNLFGSGKEDPRAETDTDVKEITAKVISAQPASYGLWTFSLGDDGVWQSVSSSLYFEPRKGDLITIKAGMLGHYTARIGKGRVVDVKRLR